MIYHKTLDLDKIMLPQAKKIKISISSGSKKSKSRWSTKTVSYTRSFASNNPEPNPSPDPNPNTNNYSNTTSNSNPEPSPSLNPTTSSNTYSNSTSNPNSKTYDTTGFDDFLDYPNAENLPFDWILRNNICGVRFFQNSIKQKQQIHVIQGKFSEYSQNNFILDFQLISSSTMEYQFGFVACILFVVEYKDCKRLFIACSGCDSSSAFQKVGHCFYTG